jgi:hypothetical protein
MICVTDMKLVILMVEIFFENPDGRDCGKLTGAGETKSNGKLRISLENLPFFLYSENFVFRKLTDISPD